MASSPLHKPNPAGGGEESKDNKSNPVTEKERAGLTTEQAEELYTVHGYNELPEVTVSLWWVFFLQFTGTMPYMLELACIISIAVQDYIDFAIILCMLLANAFLGFHEQLKAAASLAELTNKMEQRIAVLRDGKAEQLLTRLLVPGDVVLLVGGCQVPADIEWIEGDVLSVDTAALTGEPLPRKYPSDEYGPLILCASTIRAGEAYGIVRKTGINTEIGSANADIMKDKTEIAVSVFERRVLLAVKVIITCSLIDVFAIFFVQGFARGEFSNFSELLLTCLSIIIAAIPVALPLVLQVTMALGAGKMAREFDSVVTSLPALQDISSMTVLCSDKTGTLTTARISIHAESVWCQGNFSKQDVALYGVLASNPDKKEDPIDRSVTQHFERVFGSSGADQLKEYTRVRSVGFNPIYKRVVYEYTHASIGRITIAKGLPNKVLDTKDGGEDDAADQWVVQDADKLRDTVKKVDYDFSKAGYKTLGVVVKINDDPFVYCGVLPMLDPPRHDTARTISNLTNAGVEVKMITGDHLNIAKETARLIGMGTNIQPGEATREGTQAKNELIREAHGFAQVLPKDKREVVLTLRNVYNQVCGMTGDGVNDAPALSAAQCGIAVDDATDAAKNAAAIILTSPGLSAIYSAVVESRRIFRKLKSYVTYRFAATIQIVLVLTVIIFVSDCAVDSLFIVLLALLNDLTMLPIAYDYQVASSLPEDPDVVKILSLSLLLGIAETIMSLIFIYGAHRTGIFTGKYIIATCTIKTQALIWVQMFVAAELLIFSTRAASFFVTSLMPSPWLIFSVLSGCLLVSILVASTTYFGKVPVEDILLAWAYDVVGLFVLDCIKVSMYKFFNENTEVLSDHIETGSISDKPSTQQKAGAAADADEERGTEIDRFGAGAGEAAEDFTRQSMASHRLSSWAQRSNRMSSAESGHSGISALTGTSGHIDPKTGGYRVTESSFGGRSRGLSNAMEYSDNLRSGRDSLLKVNMSSRISVTRMSTNNDMGADLRTSILSKGSLRPNVPANRKKAKFP